MSRPSPHRIGETIAGRYRLISPLGEGGFGVAYRAWDEEAGVPIVLKMPLAKHLVRAVVIERFGREVLRLRQCSHPNIVPILDDGRDDEGRPFLVMRFLPGGSLADRKKPVGPAALHRWLPAVASALDYIHGKGVLHRDVKPANVFFDTQARAYLGDFGIAKFLDEQVDDETDNAALIRASQSDQPEFEESLTRTGSLIGTYAYVAPELFADRPRLTPQADQYSLAVAVYEMLSGKLPVVGTEEILREFHQTAEKPAPLSTRVQAVPASLSVAVDKAFGKRPEERFPTCQDFAAAALADIPFTPVDPSHYRFLCPACHRLVRVPQDFGGRSCRCPECTVVLRVSPSLDALWRREESPEGRAQISPHSPRHTPVKREQTNQSTGSRDDDRLANKLILARSPLANSAGMKLKLIPPGTFDMGSLGGDWMHIANPFYLGVHQVTNEQWRAVMDHEPPSLWKDGGRPVENVSWADAAAFCRKLSEQQAELAAGRVYRLPTDAEWEYACRAGTTTRYSFGDHDVAIGRYAWFDENAHGETHPVGQKQPNAWGLYDMHGNVFEWTCVRQNYYDDDEAMNQQDSLVGAVGIGIRGGSWDTAAQDCRSSYRKAIDPNERLNDLGFRVALSLPECVMPQGAT